MDHRGQCRLHVGRADGSECVVVLSLPEQSSSMPAGQPSPPASTRDTVGVGLSIATEGGVPVVTELAPWGSARWSGKIGVGDEIARVHGVPVTALSPQQIADLIDDPSKSDGGVISIAIRRRGRPDEPPITVALARSLPGSERATNNEQHEPPSPQQHTAVPDVPSQQSFGADAWNPITWASGLVGSGKKPQQFGADAAEYAKKAPPQPTAHVAVGAMLVPERPRNGYSELNQGQLLTAALEQLLDYVKNVSHENPNMDGTNLNIFQQIDSLPECSYDVGLARKIKNAVKAEKEATRDTAQMIKLSQENLHKRKEHIIKLSSQLKEAQEIRHRDLKANNEWMQLELKKERDAFAAKKAELEQACHNQLQEQVAKAVGGLLNNTHTNSCNRACTG